MRVVETSNIFYLNQPNGIGVGTEQEHDDAQSIHSTSLPLPLPLLDQVFPLPTPLWILHYLGGWQRSCSCRLDSSCEFVNDACSTSTRSGTFVRTSTSTANYLVLVWMGR